MGKIGYSQYSPTKFCEEASRMPKTGTIPYGIETSIYLYTIQSPGYEKENLSKPGNYKNDRRW